MADLTGQEWGPYRILEQIGVGGMAVVYKAYHAMMDRYVAIKVLPEQMSLDPELHERFDREVKVIARLEHPRILPVYDSGHAGRQLYLVMRYMETGTLKDRIAAGPMELGEIERILTQVGGALAYAHRRGVVHRDVKPSNVLLDAHGDCYLTDFGLARIMEATTQLTAAGVGVGTPAYMSPEQGQGEKVDARSDLYSLGVMLFEMVTGQVPYQAETPLAVVLKHITGPLPLPHAVKPDISPEVEQVILKALSKNPDDRFQTAGEMVAAFDNAVRLAEASAPLPGLPAVETARPAEVATPLAVALPGSTGTRKCPLCAETIQAEAQVCRYCGARFEVSIRGDCPHCQAAVEADEQGRCKQCSTPVLNRHFESTLLGGAAGAPATEAQPGGAHELSIWERRGEGAFMRLGTLFIDLLTISLISSAILLVVAAVRGTSPSSLERGAPSWLVAVALLATPIVWVLYFTLLEGSTGTTLGKWIGARPLAVLRVVRIDGTPCGYGRAAIRALLGLLEANPLGAIVIWLTPLHQRIGDLIAGTLVVSRYKLTGIAFQGRAATFRFADGRQVTIDELMRGTLQKWINWNRIQLTGVTPEGKRVRLRDLPFPDAFKRGQVKDELERFFKVQIVERVQWWRLIPAFLALLFLTAGLVAGLGNLQDGKRPAWFVSTPNYRATTIPSKNYRATTAPTSSYRATAPVRTSMPRPPTEPPAAPVPTLPRATATRLPSPTPRKTALPTAPAAPAWGAQVRGGNVNLRAGPGLVYAVIAVLKQGTRLTALERTEDAQWFRVKVDGTPQEGWISITVVDIEFEPGKLPVAHEIPPPPPPQEPTAQPEPTQPAAAPTPAAPGVATVQGRILWNGQPFGGVTVKICTDWRMFGGCQGTAYQTVAGDDGRYTIGGVSPGKYSVITKIPGQGNETMWLGVSVEVQAGQTANVRDVSVVKYDLKLLSPTGKVRVDSNTPTLIWEAYPGAAYYKVYVSGGSPIETAVNFVKVTGSQYTVPKALGPGEYHWKAYAYNAGGASIAEPADLSYFVVP
jgi:tRNA A-37 threonylcarbamoyl transferase component Bud32/uncharacterized RDD family membrane protein YckC